MPVALVATIPKMHSSLVHLPESLYVRTVESPAEHPVIVPARPIRHKTTPTEPHRQFRLPWHRASTEASQTRRNRLIDRQYGAFLISNKAQRHTETHDLLHGLFRIRRRLVIGQSQLAEFSEPIRITRQGERVAEFLDVAHAHIIAD